MFSKAIYASVAFGAVGLVGIGYYWTMHFKKRVSCTCEKEKEDLKEEVDFLADTVLNQTSELTAVSEPKPDIPMNVKKLGNPVAMVNQLIPCINYHHKIVSNPPSVVRVEAKIRDQFFEAEASTKKAAVMEICIEALEKFYNYEHVSAKIIESDT